MSESPRPGARVPDGAGVQLRPLTQADLPTYLKLWRRNAAYLGTPEALVGGSEERLRREVVSTDPMAPHLGIWLDGVLMGRIDIVPVAPPRFSLGYWVAEEFSGRGHATEAVRLAVGHALRVLGATDVYAGVLHENHASAAVLTKAGFVAVSDQGAYQRYHRPLDGRRPRDVHEDP